ncbi:MAG: isoaspartyl peptidase/L-asparaginase, partial [Fidelibacterota bacterium]
MMTRRTFLWGGFLGSLYPGIFFSRSRGSLPGSPGKPTVISTWSFGKAANEAAMKVLRERGSALDAVEAGARTTESDPAVRSVGYGGLPDAQGEVTLDACIMDFRGNAGSVAFLRDIKHPVSVARQVMEKSDHVMLVGEGAKRFALAHGFKEENLLTKKSRDDWLKWKSSVSKGR